MQIYTKKTLPKVCTAKAENFGKVL